MKLPSQFIVVDDDSINNMVSQYMITRVAPKARIQLFEDPEHALGSIQSDYQVNIPYPETIIFLDINMPTMSGWEFLEAISKFPADLLAHISIYILSSSIDPKDTRNAESNPLVNGYLSKPLSKEVLTGLMEG